MKRLTQWILVLAGLLWAVAPGLHAQTWTTLAPIPAPTEGMAVGGIGNALFTAYGYSPTTGDSNLTRMYSIKSNSWSLRASGPSPVRSEIAYGDTTHNGMLYVIGGRAGSPLNNLERYDPISNTWVTLASMPTARAAAAAAVLDNSIIVIGGRTGTGGPCSGGALSAVELYDIDTNTWSTLAPLPAPRSDLSAVAHGGNVYVFGGCDTFQSPVNDAFVYDPQTDSWSSIASMPTARASAVAGKKGELVYVIGGWNGGNLANNEIYDISHDTWSVGLAMPTPRSETGSFSHGGRIYVLGGGPFGASVSANEMFKP